MEDSEKANDILNEIIEETNDQKSKNTGMRKSLIQKSEQLIDDILKDNKTLDKEQLFKLSLPSFKKKINQKEMRDITLISLYLIQMKKFMKLFGDDFTTNKDINYQEQLKKISSTIIYEKFNRNRVVVKFGDEGKKFFLILKGEVQIILPSKKNATMQQREFKRYMLLLYIYKEFELLKLVIKDNKLNQQNNMFDAYYIFFDKEINNNLNNNEKEEDNKVSHDYHENNNFKKRPGKRKSTLDKINNNNKTNLIFKEAKRKKYLKKLMKYYLTEDEIAYYEKTKDINLQEVDDGLKINPIDYINRIVDYNANNCNYNINFDENDDPNFFYNDDIVDNYLIYEYKRLIELQTGDTFGDLALTKGNIKRTATIISTDECHFACLTRELYSDFIEKGNEKIRKNKIDYLCSINILQSFPRNIMEKNLFNHFGFKNAIKDNYLLKSNEINNNIIFLKDGIFEVSFTGKLYDLSDLINMYYLSYNKLADNKEMEDLDKNISNNLNLILFQKSKIDIIFQKYIKEEFTYILFLVNAPSIFGFRLTEKKLSKVIMNDNNKTEEKINLYYSNFNIKCHSIKGEYVYIDKNIFYKYIYGTDSLVQEETRLYILDFFRKIMKRLLNIIYIKLWNYFLSIGIDESFYSEFNLEEMKKTGDIYKVVNKLLLVIKEGQICSNDVSKYISDYFETKRKISQNIKQSIKINNKNYQGEKFKKIIALKYHNKKAEKKILEKKAKHQKDKNYSSDITDTNTNINIYNRYKKLNKKLGEDLFIRRMKQKMKEISGNKTSNIQKFNSVEQRLNKIINSTSQSIDTYSFLDNRTMIEKRMIKSRINSQKKCYLRRHNSDIFLKKSRSISSTGYSYLNKKSILNNTLITTGLDDISRIENNKNNETSLLKNNITKINLSRLCSSRNSRNISKNRIYSERANILKRSKEKYIKSRKKYIIKNTRILFTKTKNLDKIIRIKRVSSAGPI